MARTPKPTEPTAEQLRAAWVDLRLRQSQGGCLGERTRVAEAVRCVELEMLEQSWAAS
ncbi:MAG TPA: hypothetical protein VFK52_10690 [Nocardioidaceae bacterium]|nr:hypothetical protein [Nocardioidaceae bacterium]